MGKEYQDLVNRPNFADRFGGALRETAANNPAITPQQRAGNAFLAGAGAGAQGAGDAMRSAKLEKFEGYARELAMMDAKLKTQAGGNELKRQQAIGFVQDNFQNLLQLNKYMESGDHEGINTATNLLGQNWSKANPDDGQYVPNNDGLSLFQDADGNVKGRPAMQNIKQILSMVPEELQAQLPQLANEVLMQKLKNDQREKMAKIKKDEASTRNLDAQSDLYGAQAGKYDAEAGKIGHEMQSNTPERAKIEESLNLQKDAMKDIYKSRAGDAFYKSSMKIAEDTLKEAEKTPDKYERDLPMRATDRDGKYIRYNKDQEALHAVGAEIKGAMFKRFKYRNQAEFENLPDLSPNKSVEQNIAALKIIQNTYARMVKEEDRSISNYEKLVEDKYSTNSDQGNSQASNFVQDENGVVYKIED